MRLSIPVGFGKNAPRAAVIAAFALAALGFANAARAEDPIVGTWVGTLAQPETDPFEVTATFVSPKGGITRYPGFPCGGVLVGARKASGYEYEETVTWGGVEEVDPGCLSGAVTISLNGDTMTFSWTGTSNGQEYKASGELKRQRSGEQ
jgi:hypothetical protein